MRENNLTTASSFTDSDKIRTIDASGNSEQILGSTLKTYIEDGSITELVKSRGFDRLTPDDMGIPAYDVGTRTFSMSVKGGQTYFEFWAAGNRFEKTTTQSVVWPDTTGVHYFYFDTDGVLKSALDTAIDYDTFISVAFCGLCYYNKDTGESIVQAIDEQHGIQMPAATHFRLHMRDHSVNLMGGEVSGLTDGSGVYTGFGITLSADEDINHLTGPITSTPFVYREGAVGDFVQTATPDLNIAYATTGNALYNLNTGGVWSLAEIPNNDYAIYYFVWTNDANTPIKKFVGEQVYTSRTLAREALKAEAGNITTEGFPGMETYFMYGYIVRHTGVLEDSGSTGYVAVDMRGPKNFDI